MKRASTNGQSLVEFALVLPVLLLILLGIIEFGLAFNSKISLINAAREGARYGALHHNEAGYEGVLKSKVQNSAIGISIQSDKIFITTDTSKITVTVSCDFTVFDPVISALIGGTIPMEGSAVMALE